MSENTPFLADNDQGDEGQIRLGNEYSLPANSYFRRPLKILSGVSSLLSLLLFGFFLGTHIYLNVGPFENQYRQAYHSRSLAILHLVTAILTTPTVFLTIPILIPLVANLVMSILSLVFAIELLTNGWPDYYMCHRYGRYPDYRPLPERWECQRGRDIVRILFGVGGGTTIVLGLLLLSIAIVRLVALVRSRFWVGKSFPSFKGWRNPTGFTLQISLSILPTGTLPVAVEREPERQIEEASNEERERLIEA